MSNEPTPRRPATKAGNTGAPLGSTISIVVAAIAVIVGFLILKNIRDDSTSTSSPSPAADSGATTSTTSTSIGSAITVPSAPSTTAPLTTTGAIVIVANASNINGSAKQFSDSLAKVPFTMGTPTNAAGAEAELATSKVYYLAAGEAVARSVAQTMGGVSVEPMPTPAPTKDGTLGDATVLVMLGKDLAGKPLPIFATPATVITAAPAATAPLNNTTTTATP